jgi:hypothetical protein
MVMVGREKKMKDGIADGSRVERKEGRRKEER